MPLAGNGVDLSGSSRLRLAIEGIDQVAFHLTLDDAVGDVNWQHVPVDLVWRFVEGHVGDSYALVPSMDRADHVVTDQSFEHIVVGLEHQVFQARTELGTQEAFARARPEDLHDALVNVFVIGEGRRRHLRATGVTPEAKREPQPPGPESRAPSVALLAQDRERITGARVRAACLREPDDEVQTVRQPEMNRPVRFHDPSVAALKRRESPGPAGHRTHLDVFADSFDARDGKDVDSAVWVAEHGCAFRVRYIETAAAGEFHQVASIGDLHGIDVERQALDAGRLVGGADRIP